MLFNRMYQLYLTWFCEWCVLKYIQFNLLKPATVRAQICNLYLGLTLQIEKPFTKSSYIYVAYILVWDIYKTKCLFVLHIVLSVTKSYLHIFVISLLIKMTIGRCNIFSKYISFLWFKQKASWIFTLSYLWNNWNKSAWNDWSIHNQNTFGIALNALEGLLLQIYIRYNMNHWYITCIFFFVYF